jgi:hypothetical protein
MVATIGYTPLNLKQFMGGTSQTLKTLVVNDRTIEIVYDDSPESPRTWSNLGTFYGWHRRYTLGDSHTYPTPDACLQALCHAEPETPTDTLLKRLAKTHLVLPVYLYDHSGLALSLCPFACRFDSGQVGWMVAAYSDLRQTYSVKRITKAVRAKAIANLKAELDIYAQYLNGEVYGYQVFDQQGFIAQSCYGFYDLDDCDQQAIAAA